MKTAWCDVPIGTIVDSDIIRLQTQNELIVDGFEVKSVKQACYELRASEIFYDVASHRDDQRVIVSQNSGFVLRPNYYVVCIVKEQLKLPADVLGRILTKGHLFSIGILPVNTYADPGFQGRLGITLYNASHRYLVIKPGEAIAKIEFERLPKPVKHPYAGQHGYDTQVWPVATRLLADLNGDPSLRRQVGSESDEIRATYGPVVSKMVQDIAFYKRAVWVQVLAIVGGFTIIFQLQRQMGLMLSIAVGIASNLLTTLGVSLFRDWRRRHVE